MLTQLILKQYFIVNFKILIWSFLLRREESEQNSKRVGKATKRYRDYLDFVLDFRMIRQVNQNISHIKRII